MKRVKINDDGFVWHVRTEAEAKQLFGEQTLYALYDDDTEAEIEFQSTLPRGERPYSFEAYDFQPEMLTILRMLVLFCQIFSINQ